MKLSRASLVLLSVQAAVLAVGLEALGQSAAKLSIRLERVSSTVAGDRNIQIRTEIRNISQRDVTVMLSAPETEFTVQVIGPDGKPAPATQLGEKLRSVVPNGSQVLVTLPRHQTVSRTWTISNVVDFSKSGRYRVTVLRHFDSINETDTSNSIDVAVP